ncbi:helicase HerA-like domain-containing protein [Actinomyces procaprae]|uniref:helicase HerA-like domain-containing protein n=1 Tax=Actinomyces procaprae TaxID=2560010 RepID=UPI00109DB5A3|nr:helicase HerA-like domain-containing protein [Actinomyces procaprae]
MTSNTPDPAEIARLKAEAAQAAAEAAAAKAAAAQAALEAALAAQADAAAASSPQRIDASAQPQAPSPAEPPATELSAPAATAPPDAPATESEAVSGYAARVRDGYAFSGPVLPVGTYLDYPTDDRPDSKGMAPEPAPVPGVRVGIPLGLLNRHALVAGATGTGKTRTLQLLAEGLSAAGVPVFLSDVKGDLTGLAEAGVASDKLAARNASTGQAWEGRAFPLELFTLGDADSTRADAARAGVSAGVPIRTTVTAFGPVLLSRVLGLNDTQTSALELVFHWADAQGLALIDLKDLRSVVDYLTATEQGKQELRGIGGVSAATAGVILRQVSALEAAGGSVFFGEPALDVRDLLRTAADGRGIISSLELADIQSQGRLFSTFLMWLLGELFEVLPEVGDPDQPKLVFFFDEAHLLFDGASKAFLEAVTRTVRLIRSKGVGIVFITQSPTDVPEAVLAQLGSRIQHALRAHTPADAAKLKQAVATFPVSPLDLTRVLTGLGTGQAVVSVLDEKGRPAPVAPVVVDTPAAVMGSAQPVTIQSLLSASALIPKYATAVDNESAYELLAKRAEDEAAREEAARAEAEAKAAAEKAAQEAAKAQAKAEAAAAKEAQRRAEQLRREAEKAAEREQRARERAAERRQREVEKLIGSAGRQITRSILGNILRGR